MSQLEEKNDPLVEDLERRIDTLENMDDADFGSFTRVDYVILTVGAVLVPIIALILGR